MDSGYCTILPIRPILSIMVTSTIMAGRKPISTFHWPKHQTTLIQTTILLLPNKINLLTAEKRTDLELLHPLEKVLNINLREEMLILEKTVSSWDLMTIRWVKKVEGKNTKNTQNMPMENINKANMVAKASIANPENLWATILTPLNHRISSNCKPFCRQPSKTSVSTIPHWKLKHQIMSTFSALYVDNS